MLRKKNAQQSFPQLRTVLRKAAGQVECERALKRLRGARQSLDEIELLLEEKALCERKLEELQYRLDRVSSAAELPVVARLLKQEARTEDLQQQMAAYRSMRTGLEVHLFQLLLRERKRLGMLGRYFYPVAAEELELILASGEAESLHDAIRLYEEELERWRTSPQQAERLKRACQQAEQMEELLEQVNL